ncbi:hypothetical protein KUH32_07710 [Thalassococcus sp. CAU 1522]|uniref:DUF6455 domain-containing protein n=1 Tax=Thalassococcus arenae TaxID=2851652 RepID=A0ABS6N7Y5_9RHOB|nr:DUF6455 family protein [Thalassococcus arenae]MBV2359655.1 hypothetical protein [Thalassococcus arenae]
MSGQVAPRPLGPKSRHYWLVMRMAKATGVDLVKAMEDDQMTQDDWSRIVTRCRGCQNPDGCSKWLADLDAVGLRDAPESCINAKRFAAMKSAIEEITP